MKKLTLLLSAVLLACATNLWAADPVTVTKTVDALVTELKWTVSTSGKEVCYTSFNLDENITVSTSGQANCGSVWGTSNSDWRLYQNKSGDVTITAAEGYKINSITLTYNNGNDGILLNGTATCTSGTAIMVNDKSITLTVGKSKTSGSQNGQIKITQFSVIYEKLSIVKTVSVSIAEGQEEMGSVTMSYKADSEAADWTAATEPVEIAGDGEEEFLFVATPAEGYKFAGWTTTGEITLNSPTAATTEGGLATGTSVVTANFERDATLQSLAISGTATKLDYYVGDSFDPAGLVVTATYSDGAMDNVTDQVSWTFDPETFAEAGTVSVTVTATIDAISAELTINDIVVVEADKYAIVTDSTLLADRQHIIIVSADATYALSTNQKSTNRGAATITAKDGVIVPSEEVQIITLDSLMIGDAIKWELRVAADSFLYAASTNANHLKTRKGNSGDTQGQWTISIDAKGVATVKASGTARNWMRYNPNNGSPLFSCYEKGQNNIAIYARQYTVKVESNAESMGTVTGGGKYFENNVATLVATPQKGYKFTGWSNNAELTAATQELTVTESVTIIANFAKGETAIESAAVEMPAVKMIENGQLVIIRDGVKYNAMGVRLQ